MRFAVIFGIGICVGEFLAYLPVRPHGKKCIECLFRLFYPQLVSRKIAVRRTNLFKHSQRLDSLFNHVLLIF